MSLKGIPQTPEHISKRVLTRKLNGSYNQQGLGHKPTNTKPNSTSFKKGLVPWNTGKRINLDLDNIHKRHMDGESILDISKELNVSDRIIRIRLKEKGYKIRNDRKDISKFSAYKIKKARAKQVFPLKDTAPEVKLQSLLKELGIEFYTHQYIEIPHAYQCDILIPVQKGINKKTIIEAFGVYWHDYPLSRPIDVIRCNELRENGYRVLVFWENEIKEMELNDLKNVL